MVDLSSRPQKCVLGRRLCLSRIYETLSAISAENNLAMVFRAWMLTARLTIGWGLGASPSRPRRKTKRRKLDVSHFVDIVALDDEEQEEQEEGAEERVHHQEEIVSSGKQSFQDRIDAIIEWLSRCTQDIRKLVRI